MESCITEMFSVVKIFFLDKEHANKRLCQNYNFQTTIFSWLQLLNKGNSDKKMVKATKMSFQQIRVVCIGKERDCQCHKYSCYCDKDIFFLRVTKHFFSCRKVCFSWQKIFFSSSKKRFPSARIRLF